MSKIVDPPTQQELYEVLAQAEAGDQSAITWLQKQNNLLAKRANERMRYMEISGFLEDSKGTAAYERAQYYLTEEQGRTRFYTGKKGSLDDIAKNIEQVSNFLRSQTSTVRGELRRRDKIFASLEEGGWIDVPDDPKQASRFKRNFNRFLESDAWNDLKKTIGTNILKVASEAIQDGTRVGDLISMFKDYQTREDVDIFDVWDSWTAGKRKIKL